MKVNPDTPCTRGTPRGRRIEDARGAGHTAAPAKVLPRGRQEWEGSGRPSDLAQNVPQTGAKISHFRGGSPSLTALSWNAYALGHIRIRPGGTPPGGLQDPPGVPKSPQDHPQAPPGPPETPQNCCFWRRFGGDALGSMLGERSEGLPDPFPTLVDHEVGPSRGRRCGPRRGRPRSAAPVVYHGCRACLNLPSNSVSQKVLPSKFPSKKVPGGPGGPHRRHPRPAHSAHFGAPLGPRTPTFRSRGVPKSAPGRPKTPPRRPKRPPGGPQEAPGVRKWRENGGKTEPSWHQNGVQLRLSSKSEKPKNNLAR